MSHSAMTVTKLPTVPGTTGEHPAPPTLARAKARRSVSPARSVPDQFVAVHLDDGDLCETSRFEAGIAKQHDTVDLGRLASQAPLEGKGRIGAWPVHQDGLPRTEERLLARPGEPVLRLLDEGRPLRHHGAGHLVSHRCGRRTFLGGVCEDAEPVEGHVL